MGENVYDYATSAGRSEAAVHASDKFESALENISTKLGEEQGNMSNAVESHFKLMEEDSLYTVGVGVPKAGESKFKQEANAVKKEAQS
ncbi:MAG: hypothetical protein GY730_03225 [bacterium]|nr:hypothetical protein [bacterium]